MSGPWKLHGYTVERLLGRGASGEVWRARTNISGEAVALKRLPLAGPEQARRARAEAAMLTVLDHPNLVRLHDLLTTPDSLVLVLDLADGGSLADLLAARSRLTPGEVITAVAPVAAALAHVHRSGVVHGDVSPANLLFTPGGVALLADLGVARLIGDEAEVESTPSCIDPLVAEGGIPAAASDVFMLGAVALHALTGEPLWPSPGPSAALAAALAAARSDDLGDVAGRLAAAGAPEPMAAVVRRALTIDPARRGTAADLALDLRHSGTPVAVELAAGRARPEPLPPVPASRARSGILTRGAPTGEDAAQHPGEPAAGGGVHVPRHAAPPTSAVARRRPELPRPQRRRRLGPRVLGGLFGVVAAAGAVVWVGAVVWAGSAGGDPAASPAPAGRAAGHVTGGPAGSVAPHPSPTSAGPRSTDSVAPRDWPATLRRLDATRARAFARRRPALLRQVYLPGALLAGDTATLRRTVPVGCRLLGATTVFSGVSVESVRPDRSAAVVTARARLPSAILRCEGRPVRRTRAAGPVRLRIELVMGDAGPRIAAMRSL